MQILTNQGNYYILQNSKMPPSTYQTHLIRITVHDMWMVPILNKYNFIKYKIKFIILFLEYLFLTVFQQSRNYSSPIRQRRKGKRIRIRKT